MKNSFAFLSGAFLIVVAVVTSGRINGGLFLAGIFAGAVITWALAAIVGLERVGRALVAFDAAYWVVDSPSAATPGPTDRQSTTGRRAGQYIRSNATELGGPRDKKPSHRKSNVVTLPEKKMLRPVQQDVVSALVNLGMPMARAEQAVLQASNGRPGIDFETLLKICLPQKRAANVANA